MARSSPWLASVHSPSLALEYRCAVLFVDRWRAGGFRLAGTAGGEGPAWRLNSASFGFGTLLGGLLSRVSAYDRLGSMALAPAGIILVGFGYEFLGARTTLLLVAGAVIAPTLLVLLAKDVRELRRLDLGPKI
jgi:hypothetical protein